MTAAPPSDPQGAAMGPAPVITVSRVLDAEPVARLSDYEAIGGGAGLRAAVDQGADATLAVLDESGLRGRGGGGFPTATKWRSIIEHRPADISATVVVNAAEGEPGSFKDRTILRTNPFRVLEGALIAAVTIGADEVVVATKEAFTTEVARVREAIGAINAAGWAPEISIGLTLGPEAYLFGEETALLEVVAGRLPFPRLTPPWRRGLDEDHGDGASSADAELATPGGSAAADGPALVNNVETLAHVAQIMARGPEWFREHGTEESPGTIVCTITGRTARAGVAEVAMGTPLRSAIEAIGGGPRHGQVIAVMSGVANRLLSGDQLGTPLTYEDMTAAGSGLGTAGFMVFDEAVDPVAVAHGASRFLAVESCGQCTPCKGDGGNIADSLDRLRSNTGRGDEQETVETALGTVEVGARCFLATQHQQVVSSVMDLFPEAFAGHADGTVDAVPPLFITEMIDIVDGDDGGGRVVYDERHRSKQPDWTFGAEDSGQSPADRLDQRSDPDSSSDHGR